MRNFFNKSLNFVALVGAGCAFNAVLFAFIDLVTSREAVILMGVGLSVVLSIAFVKNKIFNDVSQQFN